jgi:hypothetical protein
VLFVQSYNTMGIALIARVFATHIFVNHWFKQGRR